ncbi:MAG: putative bifunctional diguanylate cyclase/phosphodiesterase [Prochlorococcaceae cyanobacterium]|jgi:diguanylate cyclase (GGDEF)-like protein
MSSILVVDDEPANFDVVERFLADDHILYYASSGIEAIETLELAEVDLILLDVMMPGMDGFDLCSRIKDNPGWRMIPILMITALTSKEDLAKGIAVGADDFISKPVNSIELRARVLSLLRIKSYHDEIEEYHKREMSFAKEHSQLMETRSVELELLVRQRTASLDEAIKALEHNALHDPLTDLPNRAMLVESIQNAIDQYRQDHHFSYAVLFLDIDRFSQINDIVGHIAGDQILVEISRRLTSLLESKGLVARFGGDEFVVLLTGFSGEDAVINLAKRLNHILGQPIFVHQRSYSLLASIGIVYASGQYQEANQLLSDADLAMYEAKNDGGGCARTFDASLRSRLIQKHELALELRQGLEQGDLVPYYQPIIDLKENRCIGFEALARWNHKERGLIPPYEFIPVAEENGLIHSLTKQILSQSCQQLAEWQMRFPSAIPLKISVNITADDLASSSLATEFQLALHHANLQTSSITIELTESGFIENYDIANSTAEQLRLCGFQIAIDDFGTGYSSLSYLSRMPISIIKIDRSFVSRMLHDDRTYGIVDSIITLGKRMGLHVVAEGIETSQQLELLKSLGCDFGQGYFFSKPIPAEEAESIFLSHPISSRTEAV